MNIHKTTMDLTLAKQLLKAKSEAFAKGEDFSTLTEIHALSGWIADAYRLLSLVPENWERGSVEIQGGSFAATWYFGEYEMDLSPGPGNSHVLSLHGDEGILANVAGIRADDTLRKLFAMDVFQKVQA